MKLSKRWIIAIAVLAFALASCTQSTPTPTAEPTITPTLEATLDASNPHDGLPPESELVTNADLVGSPRLTSFHFEGVDRTVNYPRGFNALCEPFNNVGTEYPCSYVDTPDMENGIYVHEGNYIAGYFGLTLDPVVTLHPSDNYRYVVRCDIASSAFASSSFGIIIRFLSDEFEGGVYEFPRRTTANNSHVYAFEVTEPLVITYQCGMDIDWASSELTWSMGYMGLQVVEPDYGEDDYFILP